MVVGSNVSQKRHRLFSNTHPRCKASYANDSLLRKTSIHTIREGQSIGTCPKLSIKSLRDGLVLGHCRRWGSAPIESATCYLPVIGRHIRGERQLFVSTFTGSCPYVINYIRAHMRRLNGELFSVHHKWLRARPLKRNLTVPVLNFSGLK
jgi:hypothetical protein